MPAHNNSPTLTGLKVVAQISILASGFCIQHAALATEYVQQAAPTDAEALVSPIEHAFTKAPLSDRFLLKNLKARFARRSEFWRDATFKLDSRTYAFRRQNAAGDKPEASVTGGKLTFQSGWWKNFGVKAAYYNSTQLDSQEPGTSLLAPGEDNINVIGEANLRYQVTQGPLEGSLLQVYRHTLNLPYVNQNDIRQLPATHKGYTLGRADSEFDYVVSHLTEFKDIATDEFVHMSEAAGAPGSNEGVSIAGARISVGENTTLGTANYYGWETFNTFYAEATRHFEFSDKVGLRLAAQVTDQRSVGEELVGEFDTYQVAAKAALSWRGAILTVAGSMVSDESEILKPWGGSPSYLSIQRYDFDRANEKAILFGLSYNTGLFSSLGVSSYINIAHGWDAQDASTGTPLPDQTEYDLTIDYKPPKGFLKGLWIRARYNFIDIEDEHEDVHDVRLIINYTLPFL